MARKDWISVFENGSKGSTNTEQITWESSSSDDEHIMFNEKKRKKLSEVNSKISPIIFPKNNLHKKHHKTNRSDLFTEYMQSPVIGLNRLELYKLSPEFSQKSTSVLVKELSPVIERRRVRLRNKRKKCKENPVNSCISPDLFNYEPSQMITSESPEFSECFSQATVKIEPFPSQCSSQVKLSVVQSNSLYYEPPKRKKKYTKGGLAHQLHKTLKLKTSRVKIWHHEKVHNINVELESLKEVIQFKLKKIWNEYGNTLLLCEVTNDNVDIGVTNIEEGRHSDLDSVTNNIFCLNIGASSIIHVEWKIGNIYELYPPYSVDRISYCGQNMLYYSNASKFFCDLKKGT